MSGFGHDTAKVLVGCKASQRLRIPAEFRFVCSVFQKVCNGGLPTLIPQRDYHDGAVLNDIQMIPTCSRLFNEAASHNNQLRQNGRHNALDSICPA